MCETLFGLAGLAIAGWALLILLPTWSVTRRIADWGLFPAFVAAIYVVGVIPLLAATGLGIMGDFGTAEGVVALLARPDVALIAWIHILAFDHVVGVMIYRDNMRHRVVPVPVQSVILFLTLMLGPVGFLSYYLVRLGRRREPMMAVAGGARAPVSRRREAAPRVAPALSAIPAPEGPLPLALLRLVRRLWAREPVLVAIGWVGVAAAALLALWALLVGNAVAPEGNLLETASFDGAVGIFILTLAALAPLAGFSAAGHRRWVRWTVGLALAAYAIETVQALRGLDPRLSAIATPLDEAVGGIFFLIAQGVMICFIVVALKYFRPATAHLPHALRLAVRYGAAASMIAFMVGEVMSIGNGRYVGAAGNMLPLHAAGFHGLQAVPLVGLLLVWADAAPVLAARWVHAAGAAWLIACVGVGVQAFTGGAPLALSPWTALAAAGLGCWAVTLGFAARAVAGERGAATATA